MRTQHILLDDFDCSDDSIALKIVIREKTAKIREYEKKVQNNDLVILLIKNNQEFLI